MPILNAQALGGLTMAVNVGVSKPRLEEMTRRKQAHSPRFTIQALIDTGATCTCIDRGVLDALAIPPTGIAHIHTGSSGAMPVQCSTFDVSIHLLMNTPSTFVFPALPVSEIDLTNLPFDALIGMDILSRALLIYDGVAGRFTLAV